MLFFLLREFEKGFKAMANNSPSQVHNPPGGVNIGRTDFAAFKSTVAAPGAIIMIG